MEEHKHKIMYLGLNKSGSSFSHGYVDITDGTFGEVGYYKTKLFKRGSVGAIFNCTLNGKSVSYRKNDFPQYYIEVDGVSVSSSIKFPELGMYEVINREAVIAKRNSSKGYSPTQIELENLRKTYKRLSSSQKSTFIADVVYNIMR